MPKLFCHTDILIKVTSLVSLILFIAGLLMISGLSLAARATAFDEAKFTTGDESKGTQPAGPSAAGLTDTFQDFDLVGTGTSYVTGTHILPPFITSGPQLIAGGATEVGKLMRLALAYTTTSPITLTHNSIAFDRTSSITSDLIVADFDFRMTPSSVTNDRADGIGFALLNTTNYGITGIVTPTNVAEEPNFTNSLGIGFDIYRSDGPPRERNNNHISIHFNGKLVREFDARPAVDLGGGQWIHARIIMRPGGGYADVTVILTPCGRPAMTVVDRFRVPGFMPYEGRVYFAARTGGLSADQDIDNVHVQFLNLSQSVLAFNTGCYAVVETDGTRLITVTRTGSASGTVTVNYATVPTIPISATEGSDYTGTSGTLTFNNGESTKTFSVPALDDADIEDDENFRVSLSNPTGDAGVGGPAIAKVTIVDDESSRQAGHWSELSPSQVIPIHMHLLPTGKVIYWDRHDQEKGWDGHPRLWDPITERIIPATILAYDIFCSGHSFMA
ncbi:MAG: hypothetical protein HYR94_03105, partial [Chloroflexi bacterium]|nr:hypothetical protein [Chloroflexota bacterium]